MLATTSNIKSIVIFVMLMIVINNTIYFNTGNLQILTAFWFVSPATNIGILQL